MSQKQNTPTAGQVENELAFRGYSTANLAKQLDLKPASIRTAVWRHGHFYGIKPIKLGEGQGARLVWPAAEVDALLQRGAA
tara:strand:+ start:50715 stop:50957 length:243 start_codon:yes stop_codon:yes gene_type:complete